MTAKGLVVKPRRLRTPEAAVYLGISRQKLRELGHEGVIPFDQGYGKRAPKLWDISDLDAYMERQKNKLR